MPALCKVNGSLCKKQQLFILIFVYNDNKEVMKNHGFFVVISHSFITVQAAVP